MLTTRVLHHQDYSTSITGGFKTTAETLSLKWQDAGARRLYIPPLFILAGFRRIEEQEAPPTTCASQRLRIQNEARVFRTYNESSSAGNAAARILHAE